MSILKIIDVICDSCGAICQGAYGEKATTRSARKGVREFGWTRKGGEDLCRKCSKEER